MRTEHTCTMTNNIEQLCSVAWHAQPKQLELSCPIVDAKVSNLQVW